MTIWVYSMASHTKSRGPVFDTNVSRTHPLLLIKEWRANERITDAPTILWYKRMDEHDWYSGDLKAQGDDPLAVQKYVDEALDENYGELP
jgi:hypothetical protein